MSPEGPQMQKAVPSISVTAPGVTALGTCSGVHAVTANPFACGCWLMPARLRHPGGADGVACA
jgi:hypothetical protein